MASTDLFLRRTLTDVLEDELYHLNSDCYQDTSVYPTYYNAAQLPLKERLCNSQLSLCSPSSSSNTQANTSTNSPAASVIANNENPTSYFNVNLQDLNMFSKYADPSLTTTTTKDKEREKKNNINKLNFHIQRNHRNLLAKVKTINLRSIQKEPRPNESAPFVSNIINGPVTSSVEEPIKMSTEVFDNIYKDINVTTPDSDNTFSMNETNQDLDFLDTIDETKFDWPLRDNTLKGTDTKVIFDNEFKEEMDEDEEDSDLDDDMELSPLSESDFKSSQLVDNENTYHHQSMIPTPLTSENSSPRESLKPVITLPSSSSTSNKPISNLKLNIPKDFTMKSNEEKRKESLIEELRKSSYSIKKPASIEESLKAITESSTDETYTCRIINLTTNEPCCAQFSRSYDLTRHQNTIHASKKTVFRCSECIKSLGNEGYDKTFSRLDALTRHIKSKHDDLSTIERKQVTKFAKENIGYVIG
ncbi:hypothetical protein NCAS_0I01820 [Naumovozyma castellii]|uniref:C2H2-type domain-containing protein n=1 Tax=Naumovozyma castellii TaxID=27288 RepID=G0VK16_NAUCA|nr:hypothetical protein NCAS_0I01820 [Naumovozyma castellii CBS 4309]CCC71850.1 hypothetical protein NCAS_0I01820 [Naumovozyma castellii CBS 4309]